MIYVLISKAIIMNIKLKRFPIHYTPEEERIAAERGLTLPLINEMPQYMTIGAAGFDIKANETVIVFPGQVKVVKAGIGVELPEGYEMQVRPRSGMSKAGIIVILGTIDSDYRGEIGVIVLNLTSTEIEIRVGDRIGQGVITKVERCTFDEVPELGVTARGDRGYGSTGKA